MTEGAGAGADEGRVLVTHLTGEMCVTCGKQELIITVPTVPNPPLWRFQGSALLLPFLIGNLTGQLGVLKPLTRPPAAMLKVTLLLVLINCCAPRCTHAFPTMCACQTRVASVKMFQVVQSVSGLVSIETVQRVPQFIVNCSPHFRQQQPYTSHAVIRFLLK